MALPAIAVIAGIFSLAFLRKLVVALGFAYFTFKGLDAAFELLKNYFHQGYYSLPSNFLALAEIGGFKQGINILFACISVRISMYAYDKFQLGFFGGGS